MLKEQLERYKGALGETLDQRINSIVSPINAVGPIMNRFTPKYNPFQPLISYNS